MPAGQLRHRVTICAPEDARDSAGQPSTNLVAIASVWARVRLARGSETESGQVVQADVTHLVTMRARAGIGPHHTLKWTDRFGQEHLLDVQYVGDAEGRSRTYTLECIDRATTAVVFSPENYAPQTPVRIWPVETPDGVRTVFTFSPAPDPAKFAPVWNGLIQDPGSYSLNTSTGAVTLLDNGGNPIAPAADDSLYAIDWVARHNPVGAIDGANQTFLFSPVPDPSVFVLVLNGTAQDPSSYALAGGVCETTFTPAPGDTLYGLY